MARVTSKLQVTIPKAIAQRYGIEPGGEIDWLPAGDAGRVIPHADRQREPDRGRRLELFERATERQRQCQSVRRVRKRWSVTAWWSWMTTASGTYQRSQPALRAR